MFPLALADQLIRTFSQIGDLVADVFCGAGRLYWLRRGASVVIWGSKGREVRQDCSGAAAMTSMIDR